MAALFLAAICCAAATDTLLRSGHKNPTLPLSGPLLGGCFVHRIDRMSKVGERSTNGSLHMDHLLDHLGPGNGHPQAAVGSHIRQAYHWTGSLVLDDFACRFSAPWSGGCSCGHCCLPCHSGWYFL